MCFADVLLFLGISLHAACALSTIRPNRCVVTLPSFGLASKASFRRSTRMNAQVMSGEEDDLYRKALEDCTKRDIVQNCPVFSNLTPDDLDRVSHKLQKRDVSNGTKVSQSVSIPTRASSRSGSSSRPCATAVFSWAGRERALANLEREWI